MKVKTATSEEEASGVLVGLLLSTPGLVNVLELCTSIKKEAAGNENTKWSQHKKQLKSAITPPDPFSGNRDFSGAVIASLLADYKPGMTRLDDDVWSAIQILYHSDSWRRACLNKWNVREAPDDALKRAWADTQARDVVGMIREAKDPREKAICLRYLLSAGLASSAPDVHEHLPPFLELCYRTALANDGFLTFRSGQKEENELMNNELYTAVHNETWVEGRCSSILDELEKEPPFYGDIREHLNEAEELLKTANLMKVKDVAVANRINEHWDAVLRLAGLEGETGGDMIKQRMKAIGGIALQQKFFSDLILSVLDDRLNKRSINCDEDLKLLRGTKTDRMVYTVISSRNWKTIIRLAAPLIAKGVMVPDMLRMMEGRRNQERNDPLSLCLPTIRGLVVLRILMEYAKTEGDGPMHRALFAKMLALMATQFENTSTPHGSCADLAKLLMSNADEKEVRAQVKTVYNRIRARCMTDIRHIGVSTGRRTVRGRDVVDDEVGRWFPKNAITFGSGEEKPDKPARLPIGAKLAESQPIKEQQKTKSQPPKEQQKTKSQPPKEQQKTKSQIAKTIVQRNGSIREPTSKPKWR